MIRAAGTDRLHGLTSDAPPRDEVEVGDARRLSPSTTDAENVVVATARSSAQSRKALRGIAAVVGSLAVHGVAAAAAIYLAAELPEWSLSQRSGKNSVALTASLATPPPKSDEPVTVVPPDTTPPMPKTAEPKSMDAEPMEAVEKQAIAVVHRRVAPFAEIKEVPPRPSAPISETRVESESPQAFEAVATEQPKRKPRPVAHALPRDSAVTMAPDSVASPSSAAATGVETDQVPALVHSVAPVYPRESQAARESGVVKVRVKVDALGNVVAASIYQSSGFSRLDQSALDAVRAYRFAAADGSSQGRAAEFVCPITFRLTQVPARR